MWNKTLATGNVNGNAEDVEETKQACAYVADIMDKADPESGLCALVVMLAAPGANLGAVLLGGLFLGGLVAIAAAVGAVAIGVAAAILGAGLFGLIASAAAI